MFFKTGWMTKSLRYQAEKILRETLFRNDDFKSNRWSFFDRSIIWCSKHIFLANTIFILSAIAVSYLVTMNYEALSVAFPSATNGLEDFIDFQDTVFGAQVTILGLIFPLVIAFIGILLQGKSSNKTLWTVYRHNSGFMLVGFSALTLTAFFIITKSFGSWSDQSQIVAFSVTTTLWFLDNLILSAWFLWKTVQFLELDHRMEMIVKYTINDVMPMDIRKRLVSKCCLEASETGLLYTGKDDLIEVKSYSLYSPSCSVKVKSNKSKYISDIWYGILNIGVWIWALTARSKCNNNEIAKLNFPIEVTGQSKKTFVLASSNITIGPIASFFIKKSVFYSTKKNTYGLDLDHIVSTLFGQIEDALKDNNFRLFDVASRNLVEFNRRIEASMQFTNGNGEKDNWMLLPESHWLGKSYLDSFVVESIDIGKIVTKKMPDDSNYYESWCYFYSKLYSGNQDKTPHKVVESYINGHYLLWSSLMNWMGGFHSDDLSSNQIKDRAIKHYIGSWEHWRYLINSNYDSISVDQFSLAMKHLLNTSCMVIHGFKYDNLDAAKWATDVLIYWYELFSERQLGHQYLGWHYELITKELLSIDEEHHLMSGISARQEFDEKVAATISLRNLWIDIRCLTSAYLMGSPKFTSSSYAKEFIKSMLASTRLEPTGGVDLVHEPLRNISDLMGVFLRQYGYWDTQEVYREFLDGHLERLSRIDEPTWVSGRGYSFVGTKRELYLPLFFKVVGIGMTNSKFNLSRRWIDFLKSDSISQADLENTIDQLRALSKIEDNIIELVSYQFEISEDEANSRMNVFVDSINEIVEALEQEISEQIIQAPLNYERLEYFGRTASESTFTVSDGPIPISLFQDIDYVESIDSSLVVTNINDYRKSEISQLEVNRVVNEDEWFNNVIKNRVIETVFRQTIKSLSWTSNQYDDSLELLYQAVDDGNKIIRSGSTPIMFIGPWGLYNLIESSKWPYSRKKEKLPFDIAIETDMQDSYICHLNEIEVHRLPFSNADFSILLTKESFKHLKVVRFGDGRYVDVKFITKSDRDLKGTLSLSFGLECDLKEEFCFKYISLNPDSD